MIPRRLRTLFSGEGVRARALRSGVASAGLMGGSQVLRFASNLVLTRLLFPEAFGLMALVQVVVGGAALLSDFGLRASVIQSDRGDDRTFLDTVWTLQIVRGLLLWLLVCAVAVPVGRFYEEPLLPMILPVCGLSLVVAGFMPTRVLTGQRHLQIGRFTVLNLCGSVAGLVVTGLLAWWLRSVWALAIGMIVSPILTQMLYRRFLPGPGDRFAMQGAAAREILDFGKYLMLSTAASYVLTRSDRAVLGAAISTDMLGIYTIGLALAMLPHEILNTLAGKVLFPLYRMRHPADSPANRAKVFWMRRVLVAATLGLSALMAVSGPWIMNLLYDDRYLLSGPVVSVMALAFIPRIVTAGSINAVLARGNSRGFAILVVATAVVQLAVLVYAVGTFGIPGVALAIAAGPLVTYPMRAVVLRRYANWDWGADIAFLCAGAALTALVLWMHGDAIALLLP